MSIGPVTLLLWLVCPIQEPGSCPPCTPGVFWIAYNQLVPLSWQACRRLKSSIRMRACKHNDFWSQKSCQQGCCDQAACDGPQLQGVSHRCCPSFLKDPQALEQFVAVSQKQLFKIYQSLNTECSTYALLPSLFFWEGCSPWLKCPSCVIPPTKFLWEQLDYRLWIAPFWCSWGTGFQFLLLVTHAAHIGVEALKLDYQPTSLPFWEEASLVHLGQFTIVFAAS